MRNKLPGAFDHDGETDPLEPVHRTVFLKFRLMLILLTAAWFGLVPDLATAQESVPVSLHDSPPLANPISPLKSMQRFISRADGDRCAMYPTCSHYASEAFAHEGIMMGWVLTCDRLLRCGRDEKRLAKPIRVQGQKYAYDPLDANTFWWKAR